MAHRDRWHLFDQILLSQNWKSKKGVVFIKSAVFNPPFLRNPEGKFRGYPYQTSVSGNTLNGYSDHFPVYVLIGEKRELSILLFNNFWIQKMIVRKSSNVNFSYFLIDAFSKFI